MKKGKVWLVGAGPGDSGLLTEKGKRSLENADAVVYDLLACPSVLNIARDDCQLIFAGKQSGKHFKKQYETNQLLADLAGQGKNVVRLKGGDPFVFGRGGEEAEFLSERNIEYEIVPGVSSCYGAAAYAGIPVTHRDFASSFHVITGHKKADGDTELDFSVLAKEEGTQVYLMSLGNLSHITEKLMENGKSPDTPAAVIQQGTTSRQRVVTARLDQIAEEVRRQNISAPALTVIGDVVNLREKLKWYEKGQLFGKKIIVTGTRKHAAETAECLRKYGADAAEISLLGIKSGSVEEFAEINWQKYTWIVFTSINGAELFFEMLSETKTDIRRICHLKFAAIGKGTAEALEGHGIYVDELPEKFESRYLAESLIPRLDRKDNVLLMRAENGTTVLQNELEKNGRSYEVFPLYRTEPILSRKELLNLNLKDADYVVFSSSSAVRAFAQMTGAPDCIKAKIVSIGSVTKKTAEEYGYTVSCTAENATVEGIAESIVKDVQKGEKKNVSGII